MAMRNKLKATANSKAERFLAIDIGGSHIKSMLVDKRGRPASRRVSVKTPEPATPSWILKAIAVLAARLGAFEKISVGFPGVVRNGSVATAPNLDSSWRRYQLAAKLLRTFGKPTRVVNDATVQGYAGINGGGVELVLTLGTGVGSALFHEGRDIPNLEVAHHRFRHGKTYEEMLGNAALKSCGKKKWNRTLRKALRGLQRLFNCDSITIGGGNARKIKGKLPSNVRIISNLYGLLGAPGLWRR